MTNSYPRAVFEAARYSLKPGGRRAARAALQQRKPARSAREHLDATIAWLFRAHDATGRRGVSRAFTLRRHHRYACTGWLPAYPETTGYIIPTLFEAADLVGAPGAAERAIELASWEAEIQMPDGAVRGGTTADPPSPAVFNTGQVLFGWLDAAARTGDSAYQNAAARAAAWLVEKQDADGVWRRGASAFAHQGAHVYNARAAWALALYGKASGDRAARDAARRSAEYAMSVQLDNGWYAQNCLTDELHPLLHTIAYTAQGVLEIGIVQDDERCIESARRAARAVAATMRDDGFVAGRLDQHWSPYVGWSCLTGQAQMAIVWDRFAELDAALPGARQQWHDYATRSTDFVCTTQDLTSDDEGVRGAVAGSFPVWGGYGTYEHLNWAAKFHCDALLGRIAGRPAGTRG